MAPPVAWYSGAIRTLLKRVERLESRLSHTNTENEAANPFIFDPDISEFIPRCKRFPRTPPGVLSVASVPVLVSSLMYELNISDNADFENDAIYNQLIAPATYAAPAPDVVARSKNLSAEVFDSEDVPDMGTREFPAGLPLLRIAAIDFFIHQVIDDRMRDVANNIDARSEILFDVAKDLGMKGKDIENSIEKLEKEVANMRDSIAQVEVQSSCSTAFEFKDLTAKLWSMKLKTYSFNVRDDDDDDDGELHATHFWMLYSRAVAEAADFSDLLDEVTDADNGFSDWMCDYGTDLLMELEEGDGDD